MYFRGVIVVELHLEFRGATPVKDLKILCSINQRISPTALIHFVVLSWLFLCDILKKQTKEKPFQTITDHFYSFKKNNLTCFNNFFLCFFSKWEGCV